jgi:hypothetical protein
MYIKLKHKYDENPIQSAVFNASGGADCEICEGDNRYEVCIYIKSETGRASFNKEDFNEFIELCQKFQKQMGGAE